MFDSKISLKTLSAICRSMATMLQSGVPIVKVVATVAPRFGNATCRRHMRNVVDLLREGEDVRTAFERQQGYFPELFVDMISVAEDTGSLPEVLRSLANHYENLLKLRREFLGQIALPVLQLIAAIVIISGVILIVGMITEGSGNTIDVFGWGLTGARGASIVFFGSLGVAASLFLAYKLFIVGFRQQRVIHKLALAIPVVGDCMRSFAVARFSWAFALTQQAGMRVVPSLEASLKATANHAFIAAGPRMCGLIKQGEDLSTALMDSRLFPVEFEQMVQTAETSGTVPEMLDHLSPQFDESARRSLKALSMVFSWMVWGLVAGFIIFAIFSLFRFYINTLNEAGKF